MPKKMYVVFCENDGTYWCGLNTWDKQLRKAKVFHSLKYANEVHRRYKELKLKNVEIRMELVTDNLTNADRIRAMSDEELAEFVFSMVDCVSCENKLMNNGKLIFGTERKTCTDEDYHSMCNGDGRKCKAVCLKWLQQPAEEG